MKGKPWLISLFSVLLIFALGCGFFTRLLRGKGTTLSTEPPSLPAPPKPTALIKGTPEEQAIFFADQLSEPETRLAGWLGLYDALGIPVIGQDGKALGTTGDDPIGPRYWELWYSSGLDKKGRGIPLSDAGRMLAVGTPELDGPALGPVLLNDLKLALKSSDPQVLLLGMFVRERIKRWPSHLDIQASDVTPEKAILDLPTWQVIAWIAVRGALMQSARNVSSLTPRPASDYGFAAALQSQAGLTATTPCSNLLGDSDVTYWTNWILKKVIARGVQLPGMEKAFPGLVERLLKTLTNSADQLRNVRKGLAVVNMVTSIMTLVMRLLAMEISAIQEPDPLIRTKATSHGKEGKVIFSLSLNPKKPTKASEVDPDGSSLDNCLGSFLASTFGITLSLPPAGRIVGSELEFKGGAGFPDRVLFANYLDLFGKDTDANGQASVAVTGVAQKRQLPENSKQIDKEFSIHVSAQPEAYNGNTIANTFFNGISFGVGASRTGAANAIVDILKTVHYDLGEHVFRVTDWQPRGYRVTGGTAHVKYSGIICSLEKPFTVIGTYKFGTVPFRFVPSSATAGMASYSESPEGISLSGNGTYTIEGSDTDSPKIVWSVAMDMRAPRIGHSDEGTAPIQLIPLDSEGCNEKQ